MYGMVNEGIREFIETNHGVETWGQICADAGIALTEFDRMAAYEDADTYKLVGAICNYTGLSAPEVLEIFGRFWVDFAGRSAFGNLIKLAGDGFVEKVENLDEMHERIKVSMPHLRPPSFELAEIGKDAYRLDYYSDREGLAGMVIGLLYGLAAETGEKIAVTQCRAKSNGSDHDSFEIRILN